MLLSSVKKYGGLLSQIAWLFIPTPLLSGSPLPLSLLFLSCSFSYLSQQFFFSMGPVLNGSPWWSVWRVQRSEVAPTSLGLTGMCGPLAFTSYWRCQHFSYFPLLSDWPAMLPIGYLKFLLFSYISDTPVASSALSRADPHNKQVLWLLVVCSHCSYFAVCGHTWSPSFCKCCPGTFGFPN